MNTPGPCTGSTQVANLSKETNHDQNDSSDGGSVYQTALHVYEKQLWNHLRVKLQNAEMLLKFARKDLAMEHLADTRKFCAEFNGTEAMSRACQDTEDIIRCWPAPVAGARRVSLGRRSSDSRLESPKLWLQGIDRMDSNGELFALLMRQLQPGADPPSPRSPLQHADSPSSLPLVGSPLQKDATSITAKSEDGFEPIEMLLPRLRDGGKREDQSTRLVLPFKFPEAMRPNTAELVNDWEELLPNSPSNFKDSEEASPRRHSFPHASSHIPGSSSPRKTRKISVHSKPQPIIGHEPRSASDTSVSATNSASNYSRRLSQDEASTVLLDTPSLTKLASQIHTNPFTEAKSLIASRVRKLSTEDPAGEAVSIEPPSVSEHPDSPPRSPLSQTFTPEDFQPRLVPTPAPTRPPLNHKVPPPLPLNTSSRQPGLTSSAQINASSSPLIPSPLREEFSASEHAPMRQEDSSPAPEPIRIPTFSSRIPRPTRRAAKPSTPVSPKELTDESTLPSIARAHVISTPSPEATEHQPSPTSAHPAPLARLSTSAAVASVGSPPSSPRRRNPASHVSRMAAQLEHTPPPVASDSLQKPASMRSAPRGNTAYAARPPWQIPGKTKATTEQAGFVKWSSEMVRGPDPARGQ